MLYFFTRIGPESDASEKGHSCDFFRYYIIDLRVLLLPPAPAVEVIESEPCVSECVSLSVNTLTAKQFDL